MGKIKAIGDTKERKDGDVNFTSLNNYMFNSFDSICTCAVKKKRCEKN